MTTFTNRCTDCNKEFKYSWTSSKRYRCQICQKRYNKNTNLKRDFNITISEYEDMVLEQDGKCAICNSLETTKSSKDPSKTKRLAVDHCHSSLKVRGLLCSNCNTALGKFKDNIEFLKNAISYLEKHNE